MTGQFIVSDFAFLRHVYREEKIIDYTEAPTVTSSFGFVTSGHGNIYHYKGVMELSAGDIFFLPEGFRYRAVWEADGGPAVIDTFSFTPFPGAVDIRYCAQKVQTTERGKDLLLSLRGERQIDFDTVGTFFLFLHETLPTMHVGMKKRKRFLVDRAREELGKDPKLHAPELAKRLAVSQTELYAAFKEEGSETLSGARRIAAVEAAKRLLAYSDRSVLEISDELGFSSPSYFHKAFSRVCGTTPAAYRRAVRQKATEKANDPLQNK